MFFLLPAILFIGIITSYQDFKFGKIKNKWILFGLFYSLIAYSLFIFFYLEQGKLNTIYLITLGTNMLFAVLIGFGFWSFKIWSPGDGKLFIIYVFLIPLSVYSLNPQKWFPSIDVLMNIFLIAFIWIFFSMLFKIRFKSLKKITLVSIKKSFEIKQLLLGAINLFAIFWVVGLFLSLANLNTNLLNMGLTMVLFLLIPKKYQGKMVYFFFSLAILRLIIDESVRSLDFFKNFFLFFLAFFIIKGFLENEADNLGQEIFNKEIKIGKLKPGMILSRIVVKKDKKALNLLKKENILFIKYKSFYYFQQPELMVMNNSISEEETFIGKEPGGLTKEQIDLMKKIGFKALMIEKTIPFAIFMFLGVLLTLTIKGNLLYFLKSVL